MCAFFAIITQGQSIICIDKRPDLICLGDDFGRNLYTNNGVLEDAHVYSSSQFLPMVIMFHHHLHHLPRSILEASMVLRWIATITLVGVTMFLWPWHA
mmetsp:Transcript_21439/g.33035  ORF Transcript_21439/g.33035 Transcript_21439/m.33035 type:complete len:98 (-) Transcript_21439:338-631(-)